VSTITVDSSYTGPHLPYDITTNQPVYTLPFAQECIEYMKMQKFIHRKYVLQVLISAISLLSSLPTLIDCSLPAIDSSVGDSAVDDSNGSVESAAVQGFAGKSSIGDRSVADTLVSNGTVSNGTVGTFTVCGDTHGQYYDLLHIFELGGFPSPTNYYLFNGDYVDRGSFSFETVFSLLLIKLALPQGLHMLRGNHETKNMNHMFGFVSEVKHKYDDTVMQLFSRLFQCLPLCAVLEKKVFIVHGECYTSVASVVVVMQ
jgi:serine/threonine-protein phosphatase 5